MKSLDQRLIEKGFLESNYSRISENGELYDSLEKLSKWDYFKDSSKAKLINFNYNPVQEVRYDVNKNIEQSKKEGIEGFFGNLKKYFVKTDDLFRSGKWTHRGKTKNAYNKVEKINKILDNLDPYIGKMEKFYEFLDNKYVSSSNEKYDESFVNEKLSKEISDLMELKDEVRKEILKDNSSEDSFFNSIGFSGEFSEYKKEKYVLVEKRINRKIGNVEGQKSDSDMKIELLKNKVQLSFNMMNAEDKYLVNIRDLRKKLMKAKIGYENYILSRKTIWG